MCVISKHENIHVDVYWDYVAFFAECCQGNRMTEERILDCLAFSMGYWIAQHSLYVLIKLRCMYHDNRHLVLKFQALIHEIVDLKA